jgi:signal transduction histidine kinase/CheY-like chemotaxis protein
VDVSRLTPAQCLERLFARGSPRSTGGCSIGYRRGIHTPGGRWRKGTASSDRLSRSPGQRSRRGSAFSHIAHFLLDQRDLVVGRPVGVRGRSPLRSVNELGFVVARRHPRGTACAAVDPRDGRRAARSVASPAVARRFALGSILRTICGDIRSRRQLGTRRNPVEISPGIRRSRRQDTQRAEEVFLQQLERAFTLPSGLSPADFQHLVQSLLERFPQLQAVEWAPRVDGPMRATFEQAKRAEMPQFEIRERDASGHLRRGGDRAAYYPIAFVEPLGGNEQAVGFDLTSEPKRAAALDAAINSGKLAATAPIRLVQESEEQRGILLLFPVRGGSMGPGVLLVVHRMGRSLDELLEPFSSIIGVRLTDLVAKKALYDSLPPNAVGAYESVFTFAGRDYRITAAPTPAYLDRHRQWQSWAVLAAGVISTGLLGALLLLGTGYTRRIETVVDERTGELESTNRRLHLEIEEREKVEAALRQAQRMEAIGQLTGGIAHDFNNLLMVVSGNAALLNDTTRDETVRRRASAIQQAADRGARLTRQLLAFSRRQALRPEAVDIRRRRSEITETLSRSLRADIDLTVEIADDVWPIMVDPAEFELALLNIGVNARDAMGEGGRLFVEARNHSLSHGDALVELLIGDFVAVSFSDTGTGMTAEVRARAFEPFFTTKEVGVGSGLGLSQVYGFAKQSGGRASIDSQIGKGTTITLYLPRATISSATPNLRAAEHAPTSLSARVLLAEDDLAVQNVATELLQGFGCQVVRACDGKSALEALEHDPAIEMLISDIAMPGGMNGLQLGRIVRQRYPGLPIVLTTGYSQYAAQVVSEGFTLVEKPFRQDALVASIRAALRTTATSVR